MGDISYQTIQSLDESPSVQDCSTQAPMTAGYGVAISVKDMD
ncbi:MAG: hypothetical protein R2758_05970 [Bacteroidales bacterium]